MTRSLATPLLIGLFSSGCYLMKSASVDETCEDTPDGCGGSASSTADADGDGYSEEDGDCDDTSADIYPGAEDIPNDGIDQDCDGSDSNGLTDADSDGFYAEEDDCDDANAEINPGMVEQCEPAGIDDDCDGLVDDEDDDPTGSTSWYLDNDGDGYGDTASAMDACVAPEAHVAEPGDCQDGDDTIHPGAAEVCDNGIDDNCNGSPDACQISGTIAPEDGIGVWQFPTALEHPGSFDVGDVTADGTPDGIIGFPATPEWPNGGVVIMDGAPVGMTPANGSTAIANVVGITASGFGRNATAIPDVTADGYADLITTNDDGVLFLVSGPVATSWDQDVYAQLHGLKIPGSTKAMLASDINGDGIADLIAAGSVDTPLPHGRLVAKPGPISANVQDFTRGTILDIDFLASYPDLPGVDSIGEVVHAVDFNGDGLNDLAVSAPRTVITDDGVDPPVSYTGSVMFFTDPFLETEGGCLNMPGVESAYGAELASGDINGDGYPELLVGDPQAEGNDRNSQGAVYVHEYGGGLAEDAWATISAADGAKLLGWSIETGETDGIDGNGLLIGVPERQTGNTGTVLGFHSLDGGSYLSTDADFDIAGPSATTYFGADLALIDMDSDGIDDVFTMMGGYSGIGFFHMTGI